MLSRISLTFFCLFLTTPSYGLELYRSNQFSLNLKGSYKNLVFTSKRAATNNWFFADLNRVRTEWDAKFKIVSVKVIWDNELIAGDFVNTEEFAARQTQRDVPYLNMDYELSSRNDFFYGQSFYRAYLQIDPGPFVLRVGRQKVDWGIMRLFSPGDLFTRTPIFDIEREERVGNTAANLTIPLETPIGALRINPVYAFDPPLDRSRIGGRVTQTIAHFDVSAFGGRFLRDKVFGADFSGDIRKAGIRGEFIYDLADVGKNFAQFAAGVDYGFENTLYFALEYFFNGQGINHTPLSPALSPILRPTANQIKSIHQNFMGLLVKYDLTPLWTTQLEAIVDLNGGSVFLNPETKYSVFTWLDLMGGMQFPVGRAGGEFTATPNVYYAQTQLFF